MMYFARMLDKIRLHSRGQLSPEYHPNLGKPKTADGACTNFLRVTYSALCERVGQGGSDQEIVEWCYEKGRRLNDGDLVVWNAFVSKLGWNDFATPNLQKGKIEWGAAARDDISTMGQLIDLEEGRIT